MPAPATPARLQQVADAIVALVAGHTFTPAISSVTRTWYPEIKREQLTATRCLVVPRTYTKVRDSRNSWECVYAVGLGVFAPLDPTAADSVIVQSDNYLALAEQLGDLLAEAKPADTVLEEIDVSAWDPEQWKQHVFECVLECQFKGWT